MKLLEASSRCTFTPQFCESEFASCRTLSKSAFLELDSPYLKCIKLYVGVSVRKPFNHSSHDISRPAVQKTNE